MPEDVAGTFTSQIKPSKDESRYTYTTGQVLYVQYKTEDVEALDCSEEVKAGLERLTVAADAAENPFDKHEGLVTLNPPPTPKWCSSGSVAKPHILQTGSGRLLLGKTAPTDKQLHRFHRVQP